MCYVEKSTVTSTIDRDGTSENLAEQYLGGPSGRSPEPNSACQ